MSLIAKLNPSRFTAMSGKMAAIVGCIIGEQLTDPQIDQLLVTSDGGLLARLEGDVGFNDFIGTFEDLKRNWQDLLAAADLKPEELAWAEQLFAQNVTLC